MHRHHQWRWFTVIGALAVLLAAVPGTAASGLWNWPIRNSGSDGAFVVYDDALAPGWYDQSWDATVNYNDTRAPYSGHDSISYQATAAWAGLDIRSDSGIDGRNYGQLTFALRASRPNQQFAIYLRGLDGQKLAEPISIDRYGGQPVVLRWTTYTIPLADLGAASEIIGHVVLHEWSGNPQPPVYVDQIQFTKLKTVDSSTPTPTPSPTPATPAAGDVIWSADTETGNLNQWTAGQYGEAVFNSGTGAVSVSHDVAHSGSSALKMTITRANGTTQAARIFRWNDPNGNALPASAYYSVWYYFPRDYAPAQWWNVLQFKSKSSSGQVDPMWVLNVGNHANGSMYFYLWDAMHSRSYSPAAQVDLPVGRWVHIETFFRRSTESSGQITIWQDGVKLFDLNGIQTTTFDNQQWSLANYTDDINPASSVIYADDAVISTTWVP